MTTDTRSMDERLLPCPFCGMTVMFRQSLHISDGYLDAIIHAAPTNCALRVFEDETTDGSIISTWNRRTQSEGAVRTEGKSHLPDYSDCKERPPLPVDTANYWFQCARDSRYTDAERWLYMENAVNHLEGALIEARHPIPCCGGERVA